MAATNTPPPTRRADTYTRLYANAANLRGTPHDCQLDLGILEEWAAGQQTMTVLTTVYLSHQMTAALHRMLGEILSKTQEAP